MTTPEQREALEIFEAYVQRHCLLCDDLTTEALGYCLGCQEALDDSTAQEREEDPDVAFHYARRERWSREVAEGQKGTRS